MKYCIHTQYIFGTIPEHNINNSVRLMGLDHEAIPPSEDEISEGAGRNYTSMVSYQ